MWVEYGLTQSKSHAPKALTIGAFDGVHLGHQALIRSMVKEAKLHGLEAVVVTFHPLPRQVLYNDKCNLLSTLEERLAYIDELGVNGVVVLPFDKVMMTSTAHDFIVQLVESLRPGALWVGPDFRFGKDRTGDQLFLTSIGKRYGFKVHAFQETVCWNGEPVHSSRIRQALLNGNLDEVNGCLGRPFSLTGTVGDGDKRGRTLGFPTANLILPKERMLPANGVYIARAKLGPDGYISLVNVGTRPTFNHNSPTVEAYLLDFSADIYGAKLTLNFLQLLRAESKFSSADGLVLQMHKDVEKARVWWKDQ